MKTITLKISGMHCASCSILIEKSLGEMDGIKKISVSLASNSAMVKYNEKKITLNDIEKAINEVGYKVVQAIGNEMSKRYLHKFILSFLLALPIGASMFVDLGESKWTDVLLLGLGAIIVLIIGANFHIGFIKKLRKLRSNMDTLISIGTLIALGYSTYAVTSNFVYGTDIAFHHFLEGAVFIIVFITLGKFLELNSKGKASESLEKLMQLQSKNATILLDGKEKTINIDDIKKTNIVVVKAGDKIPIDGKIVKGTAHIDESMLTGESIPSAKTIKDEVFSGTIVQDATLHIKVSKLPTETALSQIIKAVNEAQSSKPEIQNLADDISGIFVPVILLISIIAFSIWYWITGNTEQSLLILVSTIVVACPCAMGLATPMAIMVATGTGARKGILIKSTDILETSQNIDTVVFDKTGTLTEGKPQVTNVYVFKDFTKETIVKLASGVCINSHHPLSQAIVKYGNEQGIEKTEILNFLERKGEGLIGYMSDTRILVGNKKLMEEYDIKITEETESILCKIGEKGGTPSIVSYGKNVIGILTLIDTPKKEAKRVISKLKSMGIKTLMVSGDHEKTVEAIGKQLGIDKSFGGVLPKEKAQIIKDLQKKRKIVAFAGDGINDAPALAQADLGVGMGSGTDIAIESSDIILVKGNPYKIVEAIQLSQKTYKIIKQNLFWAFAYNSILVPVAAIGLLLPMYASLAMSLSSVSVVFNSLRLKKI